MASLGVRGTCSAALNKLCTHPSSGVLTDPEKDLVDRQH